MFWIAHVNSEGMSVLHGSSGINELVKYKSDLMNKSDLVSLMQDFNLVDMAFKLPADQFADRWCACGHLNEVGQLSVGSQLAACTERFSDE